MQTQGLLVAGGHAEMYNCEEIYFDAWYLTAIPQRNAIVNSVFITHVDDCLREWESKTALAQFDSAVCMSPQDADFLRGIICSSIQVIGINLPPRTTWIQPTRICIFSERYPDQRKNEQWLIEYLDSVSDEVRSGLVLVMIGHGWETYLPALVNRNISYELYRYRKTMPNEYELARAALRGSDLMIYMGNDGGAMSIYDAILEGVPALVPNISYHKKLPSTVSVFDTKPEFFSKLNQVLEKRDTLMECLEERSIKNYARALKSHLEAVYFKKLGISNPVEINNKDEITQAVRLYRNNYKQLSLSRIKSFVSRRFQFFFNEK